MNSKVRTPCIGICSTGIGDSVCRGCKRFAHEVIDWNGYSVEEQGVILDRIEMHLAQVVGIHLRVVDVALLRASLAGNSIPQGAESSPQRCAYEAIRAFGGSVSSLSAIGCEPTPEWRERPLEDMKKSLEEHFYQLSCAHYERYFDFA